VVSRPHGRKRAYFYQGRTSSTRGAALCTNTVPLPMTLMGAAVLAYLEPVLLHPEVITEALRRALTPDPLAESPDVQRSRLTAEHAQIERELARLVQAILDGDARETATEEIWSR
jgi:hypothetical protein